MNQEKINKQILARIKRLEQAVFAKKKVVKNLNSTIQGNKSFKGAKGGCELLIDKNFFSKKRTAYQVREKLVSLDYHYSIQVVQTTLNRLSTKTGPLLSFKESGNKYYVIRK